MTHKYITLHREPTAAGMAALGIGTGLINDFRQVFQQERLNRQTTKQQKALMDYQMQKQLEMWEKTGYKPQMEQIRKAGLNPALLYGMSGGGAQTIGGSIPGGTGAHAPAGGGEIPGIMTLGLQMELQKAQIENIKADTQNKQANTPNITADTENKILQSVVLKYTGMEAKDFYERVASPNRGIQAKTYQEELEARQGVAGTIYELWLEGKLHEKSTAEIEQLVLNNEKTRQDTRNVIKTFDILEENLKGAKLDNAIKELEKQMQTLTGIDRNSPFWLKILGRLFTTLMSK